jgi:hypothetical protein
MPGEVAPTLARPAPLLPSQRRSSRAPRRANLSLPHAGCLVCAAPSTTAHVFSATLHRTRFTHEPPRRPPGGESATRPYTHPRNTAHARRGGPDLAYLRIPCPADDVTLVTRHGTIPSDCRRCSKGGAPPVSTEEDLIPEETVWVAAAARAPSWPPHDSTVRRFSSNILLGSDARRAGFPPPPGGPGFQASHAVMTGCCCPSRRSPARWFR